MPCYLFVVLSNPVAGREDAYNRWYDEQHLEDVLAVPGFVRARRLRIAADQPVPEQEAPWRYLALYEIETDNLPATLEDMRARVGGPFMQISDAIDLDGCFATIFTEPD